MAIQNMSSQGTSGLHFSIPGTNATLRTLTVVCFVVQLWSKYVLCRCILVVLLNMLLPQAFKFIFTSPSSAQEIENQEDLDEHVLRPKKRARKNQKAPTRGHVANLLGMKSVTPRSLAYVAVQVSLSSHSSDTLGHTITLSPQVRFALSNVSAWSENDGCFSYVAFYHNILDYFEIPAGPESQAQTAALLVWWTRLVQSCK